MQNDRERELLEESESGLRMALSALDSLGRHREAALVCHVLELLGAEVSSATRVAGE